MPRIDDRFLRCVVYLYPSVKSAQVGERAGGTGFLVGIPSEASKTQVHLYAVTNAHVIANGAPVVRINRYVNKDKGEIGHDTLDFKGENWTYTVGGDDLAVCPLMLESGLVERHGFAHVGGDYAVWYVEPSDFLTPEIIERCRIGPGDETFMVGRFVTHEGAVKNTPAVRFGNIAIMNEEPLWNEKWKCEQESFLVETRSLGGYSGSPVFVYVPALASIVGQPPNRDLMSQLDSDLRSAFGGDLGPWLLGIDWCHLTRFDPVVDRETGDSQSKLAVRTNTGMMGVIPAWRLADLLNEREYVKQRRAKDVEIRRKLAESPVVMDSAQGGTPSDTAPIRDE